MKTHDVSESLLKNVNMPGLSDLTFLHPFIFAREKADGSLSTDKGYARLIPVWLQVFDSKPDDPELNRVIIESVPKKEQTLTDWQDLDQLELGGNVSSRKASMVGLKHGLENGYYGNAPGGEVYLFHATVNGRFLAGIFCESKHAAETFIKDHAVPSA